MLRHKYNDKGVSAIRSSFVRHARSAPFGSHNALTPNEKAARLKAVQAAKAATTARTIIKPVVAAEPASISPPLPTGTLVNGNHVKAVVAPIVDAVPAKASPATKSEEGEKHKGRLWVIAWPSRSGRFGPTVAEVRYIP